MVIIHIANIDISVIGGVQIAVPRMVREQSKYANVGLVNTHGDMINDIQMLNYNGILEINKFSEPFNKPDIVIFHEVYRFEYIKIYHLLVSIKIPYIIIPHGCLSKKAQQKKYIKKLFANILFFNEFIKSAKSIQYLSDNEKRMSAFFKYNSFVSGNGVQIPIVNKVSFSNNGIRFVYIGRLDMRIKGLDLMLKAVKKCENLLRKQNAVVQLYGPNDNKVHERIKKEINRLNIADLVYLDKEKVGKEKEKILLSADCFIQTSRTEGLPLGVLEALGYGLPCIVTDGVGLGEMIESFGAGYRCDTKVDGIAEAIKRFIEKFSKIDNISQSAIKLVEEKFDINLIAKKTVDIYCKILNKL